jgi:predicted cobalt transporter CbtA
MHPVSFNHRAMKIISQYNIPYNNVMIVAQNYIAAPKPEKIKAAKIPKPINSAFIINQDPSNLHSDFEAFIEHVSNLNSNLNA